VKFYSLLHLLSFSELSKNVNTNVIFFVLSFKVNTKKITVCLVLKQVYI